MSLVSRWADMRGHVSRTYYSNKILRRHVAGTCSGDILSRKEFNLLNLMGHVVGTKYPQIGVAQL